MCRGGAERVRAGDTHDPDLAGPGVEVAENLTVERAQVVQVVAAGKCADAQLGKRGEGQARLDVLELLLVGDAEPVAQYSAVGIEVRVDGHCTP